MKALNPQELVTMMNGGDLPIHPRVAHLPLIARDVDSGTTYKVVDLECDGNIMVINIKKED